MHERFGGYDAETKLRGSMRHIPPEQAVEAESFRRMLQNQPEEAVRRMFRQRLSELAPEAAASVLDREASLFFNRPSALSVNQYWGRMPLWSISEAAALTLGRDPRVVNWEAFEKESVSATPFANTLRNIEDLIERSVLAGHLDNPLEPSLYLSWCERMGLAPPTELIAEVEDLKGARIDWPAAYWRLMEVHQQTLDHNQNWAEAYAILKSEHEAAVGRLAETEALAMNAFEQLDAEIAERSAEIASLKARLANAEKDLGPRERESLLKAFLASTIYGLGFDPRATKSPIPGQIAAEAERLDIPVSDATVLKWLRAAVELLPPKAEAIVA
jgi:hypothetical protein